MEDIASKLTEFLEDDKNVELLKGVADGFKKDGGNIDLSGIGTLMQQMGGDDDRARLLRALKPFVDSRRGEMMEEIIRLLKVGELVMMYLNGRKT
jgi:hypothetical protein